MYLNRTLLTAAVVAMLASPGGGQTRTAEPRIVNMVAERFTFSPADLRIAQGTVVEFRITSDDTDHGFRLVGPEGPDSKVLADVEIPKRGRGDVRVTFEALAPGRYTFECSRLCGAGHGFMRGRVRVEGPAR
jgi:cytochrome c oxidase subunit 2